MPLPPVIHFGANRLDREGQRLWVADVPVELRPKTWQLLLYLLTRPGELVSVQHLLEALWPGQDVTPKALTNRIVELRRVLGDDPERPRTLQTLHRRGYRLNVSVTAAAAAAPPERAAAGPQEPAPGPGLRPFVGREQELAVLQGQLQAALGGRRQVVLLGGEAGIGKSSLTDVFLGSPDLSGWLLGRAGCLEQSSEREAFGPWLQVLADLAAGPGGAQVLMLLRRCAPSWLVQMPWLLDEPEARQLRLSLQGTGAGRMLREAGALLQALSQLTPVVLVLEDLHWADAASIDLLAHLGHGHGAARLLVLASARTFDADLRGHPYAAASLRMVAQGQATELRLGPLSAPQVAACVQQRFGAELAADAPLQGMLHQRCEGHPLYLVATLDHLVERGWLACQDGCWHLTVDPERLKPGLPEPLRDTIGSRLHLLDPDAQRLLQAASVIGMQWPLPLLQAVLQWPEDALQATCARLARASGFLRPLASQAWPALGTVQVYGFGHDTYRRVLYERLAPALRQDWHRRVAQALEAAWAGRVHEVAGALATAYERSGQPDAAARMLEMAAGVAVQRYAYREAAEAIDLALRQLTLLPGGPARDRDEQRLLLTLGSLRGVTRGPAHASQQAVYERAHGLAMALGEPQPAMRAVMGLCLNAVMAGRAGAAQHWARSALELAGAQLPRLLPAAHCYAGLAEIAAGDVQRALAFFERSLELPVEPGTLQLLDVHALAGAQRAWLLALSGRESPARAQIEATLAHCRRVCLPVDMAQNLHWLASALALLGDTEPARAMLVEVQALAEPLDALPFAALAAVALQALRPAHQRTSALDTWVHRHATQGEDCYSLPMLLLLVETRLLQGQATGAAEAWARVMQLQPDSAIHAGERLRVQAAMLAAADPEAYRPDHDRAIHQALVAAVEHNLAMGTMVFALRAATALVRHARQRGPAEVESRQLLAVTQRFEPDSRVPELLTARAVLASGVLTINGAALAAGVAAAP